MESLGNRTDHVEDRLSGTEDKIEEMDFFSLRKVQLIRKKHNRNIQQIGNIMNQSETDLHVNHSSQPTHQYRPGAFASNEELEATRGY